MSFRFNFSNASDVSLDDDNDIAPGQETSPTAPPPPASHTATPPRFHTLEELVSTLPNNISYNTLTIPNARNPIYLPRRELYDVRMQLMAEDDDLPIDSTSSTVNPTSHTSTNQNTNDTDQERTSLLEFINGSHDVRSGIYEGGLKSWECSIDLTQWLSSHSLQRFKTTQSPTHILELGCGTSLPSLYLLQQALQGTRDGAYTFHLADYNYSVLRLVTLPNIFLSWVLITHTHLLPLPTGDLDVTEELKSTFLSSLQTSNINLGFISGAWGDEMLSLLLSPVPIAIDGYDLVLGSETIYEPRTMGDFTKVLLSSLGRNGRGLVSAKRIYFGVGGSVGGFVELVKGSKEGWDVKEVESVGREKGGVGGVILEVKRVGERVGERVREEVKVEMSGV